MPPTSDVEVVGSVVLNPIFNYHRHVAIVKRFLEQLVTLSDDQHLGSEAIAYVRQNIPHVVNAMGEILSDDIEHQIRLTKDFPLRRPAITFHGFVEQDGATLSNGEPICVFEDCFAVRDWLVHTL